MPQKNGLRYAQQNNGHHLQHQNRAQRRRTRSTGFQDEVGAPQYANDHFYEIFRSLNEYRLNEKFTDVEIRIDGRSFPCHKLILSSISPYFEAMFSTRLKEAESDYVDLHGISDGIFELILDYVYSGEIEINDENVQELLPAANMLQLARLLDKCCFYLSSQLTTENSIGIFRFAEIHSCTLLKLTANRFIESHFPQVVCQEEFLDISLCTLKSFLKSEGLSIYNEFQVLVAAIDWILKDPESRRIYLNELVPIIRLPLISQKQLDSFLENIKDVELRSELSNTINNQEIGASLYPGIRWQPRMSCVKSIYVVGGLHKGSGDLDRMNKLSLSSVELFDSLKKKWESLAPMRTPRYNLSLAVLGWNIYAAGGESGFKATYTYQAHNQVEAFDPLSKEWSLRAPMTKTRSHFGLCSYDGYLYAFGGLIRDMADYSIERYNPKTNNWELYDNLKYCTFGMGIAVIGEYIYIMGGYDGHQMASKRAFRYHPGRKELVELRNMRSARALFGIGVLHDKIYAIGGSDGSFMSSRPLNSSERYNVEDNNWTKIANMRMARAAPALVPIDNQLYVLGGRVTVNDRRWSSYEVTTGKVEIYEPELNRWRDGVSMITSRSDAGVVVM